MESRHDVVEKLALHLSFSGECLRRLPFVVIACLFHWHDKRIGRYSELVLYTFHEHCTAISAADGTADHSLRWVIFRKL